MRFRSYGRPAGCARAVSGHAAAPASKVTKPRRCIPFGSRCLVFDFDYQNTKAHRVKWGKRESVRCKIAKAAISVVGQQHALPQRNTNPVLLNKRTCR